MELSTQNLLHPRQVAETKERRDQLSEILSAPPHIRNQLQDGGANIRKQVQDADMLLRQAPQPIPPEQYAEAVKAEKTLRESWLEGMPTQAEMRRNPPGAVDKNISWTKNKSGDVKKWKNLRRRMHATEKSGSVENDVSNIEMFRPSGGSGELNMDNAQIEGKQYLLPPEGAELPVVISEEDKRTLQDIDPEIAGQLALLDNDQRSRIKEFIKQCQADDQKSKGGWTPERRAEASRKAKERHAKSKEG